MIAWNTENERNPSNLLNFMNPGDSMNEIVPPNGKNVIQRNCEVLVIQGMFESEECSGSENYPEAEEN